MACLFDVHSASFEAHISVMNEYIRNATAHPVRKAEVLMAKAHLLWRLRRQLDGM